MKVLGTGPRASAGPAGPLQEQLVNLTIELSLQPISNIWCLQTAGGIVHWGPSSLCAQGSCTVTDWLAQSGQDLPQP